MKILILHNQLWSQYKSIIFENINNLCQKNGDELLVLQTSISEISRKDLIDFDEIVKCGICNSISGSLKILTHTYKCKYKERVVRWMTDYMEDVEI